MKHWKLKMMLLSGCCEVLFAVHKYPQLLNLRQDIMRARHSGRGAGQQVEAPGPVDFEDESHGSWVVKRDLSAGIIHYSGAVWTIPGATSCQSIAEEFLRRHATDVLGLDGNSLQIFSGSAEQGPRVVVFRQLIDGVLVYNSFVRFEFDDKSNLVDLSTRIYLGSRHSVQPVVSMSSAAGACLAAVREHVAHSGGEPSVYVLDGVLAQGEYVAVLGESVGPVNMYHFTVPMLPPLAGVLDIFVDAGTGSIDSIKNVAATIGQ